MIKCKVDIEIGTETTIITKARTSYKAKLKAIDECYNKGYFYAEVLSCQEITEEDYNNLSV